MPRVSPVCDPPDAFLWLTETETDNGSKHYKVSDTINSQKKACLVFSLFELSVVRGAMLLRWKVDIGGRPLLMSAASTECGEYESCKQRRTTTFDLL